MDHPLQPNPVLRLRAVRPAANFPRKVDVAIIGGGLVGVSAAWHLAGRGLRVALFEKGVIAGEQSGRNWGWCRFTLRDPAEIPLMQQSMRDWSDPAIFGSLDTGFRRTGIMYLCGRVRNDEEAYLRWLDDVRPFGLDSRMLSPAEADRLVPGSARPGRGGLYTPADGCAEPEKATARIAEAAQALGAAIVTGCAVRTIEFQAGRVSSLVTERGEVECGAVLLAAGTWSRLFAANLGIDLPQINVLGSVMVTEPMAGGPNTSVAGRGFGWRKRADGGYIVSQADATILDLVPDAFRLFNDFRPAMMRNLRMLRFRLGRRFVDEAFMPRRWKPDETTPFEKTRIAAPRPAHWVLRDAANNLRANYPFFKGMKIAGSWGGYIEVTPDALPVLSPVQSMPGLFVATGLSGHGFGLGPGAGRLAADLVAGDRPVVDPAAFRLERFARATRGPSHARASSISATEAR
jgi:glycine/D-amino acid oxidase-like deaminating enzyme